MNALHVSGVGWLTWPADSPRPVRVDFTKLLACACGATMTQTCRTRSGHTSEPHSCRTTPRVCVCGVVLSSQRRYCDPCAAESLRVAKRDYLRRRRAAARAA